MTSCVTFDLIFVCVQMTGSFIALRSVILAIIGWDVTWINGITLTHVTEGNIFGVCMLGKPMYWNISLAAPRSLQNPLASTLDRYHKTSFGQHTLTKLTALLGLAAPSKFSLIFVAWSKLKYTCAILDSFDTTIYCSTIRSSKRPARIMPALQLTYQLLFFCLRTSCSTLIPLHHRKYQ